MMERGCVISLFWQKLLFDYQIVTNRKMPIYGLLTHPLIFLSVNKFGAFLVHFFGHKKIS